MHQSLLLCVPLLLTGTVQSSPRIFVAYPPAQHRVAHSSVLLEGSITAGAKLSIGNKPVSVGPDGLFILWWPLTEGQNLLNMVATYQGKQSSYTLPLTRVVQRPLPTRPTQIQSGSVWPQQPISFWFPQQDTEQERTLAVGFVGSAQGKATAQLGNQVVTLQERPIGVYSGHLKIAADSPAMVHSLQFSLIGQDGRRINVPGSQVLVQPTMGPRLGRQGSVLGLGINDVRSAVSDGFGKTILYPKSQTQYTVVGQEGKDYRVRLAPHLSGYVPVSQVELQDNVPASTKVGEVRVDAQDDRQIILRVALENGKLPHALVQSGVRQLTLTLYGTDRPILLAENLSEPHHLGEWGLDFLQTQATPVQLHIHLRQKQLWGFYTQHDPFTDNLLIVIKKPPTLHTTHPQLPLSGRTITLDAGHGGTQSGGQGSFGIHEKDLVLPITLRAAQKLRALGATVVLTRDQDITLDLYQRALLAESSESELLVSVHANALPDGIDPRGIRGPEVFYSHMQAEPLAAAILAQLRRRLPENGAGAGLKPRANFALTRPTTQISLLVELAYLTDPQNLRSLHNPDAQERYAQALASGIAEFYGVSSHN